VRHGVLRQPGEGRAPSGAGEGGGRAGQSGAVGVRVF
jgi:hypothetical protein